MRNSVLWNVHARPAVVFPPANHRVYLVADRVGAACAASLDRRSSAGLSSIGVEAATVSIVRKNAELAVPIPVVEPRRRHRSFNRFVPKEEVAHSNHDEQPEQLLVVLGVHVRRLLAR